MELIPKKEKNTFIWFINIEVGVSDIYKAKK